MSINRCNLSGNLGREPELRQTQGGTQVLTFSLAVSDRKRNQQSGEWEDVKNWVPCVVFGNRAESLSRFLTKGMKCAVEGKLRQSTYKDKNGQNRSKLEVIVDEIEFMSRQGDSKAQNQAQSQQPNNYSNQGGYGANSGSQQPTGGNYTNVDIYDEDVPF